MNTGAELDSVPRQVVGPYRADLDGVYSSRRGPEQWLLVAVSAGAIAAIFFLPIASQEKLSAALALIFGVAIGSSLSIWWRQRHPLPLLLLREGQLMAFAPGWVPKLIASLPLSAVQSLCLSMDERDIRIDWVFRDGRSGISRHGDDPRLLPPLRWFLERHCAAQLRVRLAGATTIPPRDPEP